MPTLIPGRAPPVILPAGRAAVRPCRTGAAPSPSPSAGHRSPRNPAFISVTAASLLAYGQRSQAPVRLRRKRAAPMDRPTGTLACHAVARSTKAGGREQTRLSEPPQRSSPIGFLNPNPAKSPQSTSFGQPAEKRPARIAHNARSRPRPCPDTLKPQPSRKRHLIFPEPTRPRPFRPEHAPVNRPACGPQSPRSERKAGSCVRLSPHRMPHSLALFRTVRILVNHHDHAARRRGNRPAGIRPLSPLRCSCQKRRSGPPHPPQRLSSQQTS